MYNKKIISVIKKSVITTKYYTIKTGQRLSYILNLQVCSSVCIYLVPKREIRVLITVFKLQPC